MPLTILVADDDLAIRLAVQDYLEAAGYSVLTAENGLKALSMVQNYQPHLLITDITMPQMDGYDLVQQVRQNPSFRLMPVLFLTARNRIEERVRGYQLGCDLYLPKPFDLAELGAVVRNLLERSQIVQTQLIQAEWRTRTPGTAEASPSAPPRLLQTKPTNLVAPIYLTEREQEVLQFLAEGLSNIQIGDRLHLSPRTVEKHVSSLLRKAEASNRAELVRLAMEQRLLG